MSEPGHLFAYILDNLSRKPHLSETLNNLLNDIKYALDREGVQMPDFQKHFEDAIDIGSDLGVLKVRNENVRMNFSLHDPTDFSKPKGISASGYENKKLYDSPEDCRGQYKRRSRRQSRNRSRSRSRKRSRKGGR